MTSKTMKRHLALALEIRGKIKELEKELEKHEKALKEGLTDSGMDTFVDGDHKVTYKEVVSMRFCKADFEKVYPNVYDEFKRPSSSMRFTISWEGRCNMYNYRKILKRDINYFLDDVVVFATADGNLAVTIYNDETYTDRDTWYHKILDLMAYDDYVTGGYSNEYTEYEWVAKDYVTDNPDLFCDMVKANGISISTLEDWFLNEDWKEIDVLIRQYLLPEVFDEVLNDRLGGLK